MKTKTLNPVYLILGIVTAIGLLFVLFVGFSFELKMARCDKEIAELHTDILQCLGNDTRTLDIISQSVTGFSNLVSISIHMAEQLANHSKQLANQSNELCILRERVEKLEQRQPMFILPQPQYLPLPQYPRELPVFTNWYAPNIFVTNYVTNTPCSRE